jgi:hypothetical protein
VVYRGSVITGNGEGEVGLFEGYGRLVVDAGFSLWPRYLSGNGAGMYRGVVAVGLFAWVGRTCCGEGKR